MIVIRSISSMDDGFRRIKFRCDGRTISLVIPRDLSIYDAIKNYVKDNKCMAQI